MIKYDIGEQVFFVNADSQFIYGLVFDRIEDKNGKVEVYFVNGRILKDPNSPYCTYRIDRNGIKKVTGTAVAIYKEDKKNETV